MEATRAQLEAAFGNGSKPPWADAGSPDKALKIISALCVAALSSQFTNPCLALSFKHPCEHHAQKLP